MKNVTLKERLFVENSSMKWRKGFKTLEEVDADIKNIMPADDTSRVEVIDSIKQQLAKETETKNLSFDWRFEFVSTCGFCYYPDECGCEPSKYIEIHACFKRAYTDKEKKAEVKRKEKIIRAKEEAKLRKEKEAAKKELAERKQLEKLKAKYEPED